MAGDTDTKRELTYTPQEVSSYTLEEIQRRRDAHSKPIQTGIVDLDKRMNPLRPGDLVIIMGRPSNYKTGFAQWWARKLAEAEKANGGRANVVVYATCEMAIEELGIYDLSALARLDANEVANGQVSDEQWQKLQAASMRRAILPLWLLGHSLVKRKRRQRISVYTIERALHWIEDNMEFRASAVFLDYLNLMRSDRRGGREPTRRVDVADIVQCAKDLALSMACPVIMLAQAHRRVDDRDWQLPTMRDGMETAAIEQYADVMLSLWMPSVGSFLDYVVAPNGKRYDVTQNLLFWGLTKQKRGTAGCFGACYVDFLRSEIHSMDVHKKAPRKSTRVREPSEPLSW